MTDRDTQQRIIEDLEVVADFDAACETERRIRFLAEYIQHTGTQGLVLGISGGVDSTVAGRLCQLACERVRAEGGDAAFVAIRLPYGVQKDEADANQAVAAIAADEVYTVNIKGAVDGMWDACLAAGISIADERNDFVKGNVKARERMIAQYTVAGARNMLVVGTDQAAEAVVGFFTKYGDGGVDLNPIADLTKTEVYEVGRALGVDEAILSAAPTDGLWGDDRTDEDQIGASYPELEWAMSFDGDESSVSDRRSEVLAIYRRLHAANRHKMEPIPICKIPDALR